MDVPGSGRVGAVSTAAAAATAAAVAAAATAAAMCVLLSAKKEAKPCRICARKVGRDCVGCEEWAARIDAVDRGEMSEEKRKMIAEEIYDCMDPQLVRDRGLAHDGSALLNKLTLERDRPAREAILRRLLGSFDAAQPPCIEPPFYCDYGSNISLGKNVFFNFNTVILDCARVRIGDNTMLGPGCMLVTATHPLDAATRHSANAPEFAHPIEIGRDCWLASGVIILPGVTIGDRCVVAAGAVVTKDVPSDTIVAGVPGRPLRRL